MDIKTFTIPTLICRHPLTRPQVISLTSLLLRQGRPLNDTVPSFSRPSTHSRRTVSDVKSKPGCRIYHRLVLFRFSGSFLYRNSETVLNVPILDLRHNSSLFLVSETTLTDVWLE